MRLYGEKLKKETLDDVEKFMDSDDMTFDEALLFNLLLEIKELRNNITELKGDINDIRANVININKNGN